MLWIDLAKRIPEVPTSKFDIVANDIVNRALTAVLAEGADIEQSLWVRSSR